VQLVTLKRYMLSLDAATGSETNRLLMNVVCTWLTCMKEHLEFVKVILESE
jgi:hypothetical protein